MKKICRWTARKRRRLWSQGGAEAGVAATMKTALKADPKTETRETGGRYLPD